MKLETFFEKFDQFADAPDAVAKMRELILESAIRGKLVPQDRRDEPASELLKRVGRMQDGLSKKRPPLPPVGNDAYLELPAGWEWTRLGNTGRIFNGDSVSESGKGELSKVAEGLPFIATKDVGYGRDVLAYDNGLKVPLNDPRFKVAPANAVLICAEGGSAGRKIGITDRDICFGNKLYANEVSAGIHHRYIFYVYQAPTFFREFAGRMTGIIGGIARSEFLSLPIPLPPEKEQKRIVAKVDELMALCDRLEAQQQERETRHAALARASLARFADAPTPANLHFLFHPSYAIPPADLRKSILTLAVQGKLVPQDPNDEPAEEFLNRTKARHVQSSNGSKSRKEKTTAAISDDEIPFAIPESWAWCRLETIADKVTDGEHLSPVKTTSGMPLLTATHVTARGVTLNNPQYVSVEDGHKSRQRCDPTRGDILICSRGTIGRCAVVETDEVFCLMGSVILVRFPAESAPRYFNCFLSTDLAQTEMRGMSGATAVQALYLKDIRQALVPIPPLAEQRRIVAKVDQLMALVDELETQLAASRATAANLLSALVAELTTAAAPAESIRILAAAEPLAPYDASAKIIDLHASPEFIRTALAAEIADRLRDDPYFGQVKLQKILYLAEYHFHLSEIDSCPRRHAAGPHDPKLIDEVEARMRDWEWFRECPRTDGIGHRYEAMAHAGAHRPAFERLWPTETAGIRRLIDDMKMWKKERCERFATLYAAWNDLLIWGHAVTDAAILDQVLEKWDPAKKLIPREKWIESLQWMREHGYIPTGFGRATADAPQAELML